MRKWFKKIYSCSLLYVDSKWSPWAIFLITIADATFLPVPTTYFFIAVSLLNTRNALKYALFATLGTLTGAMAGYLIGHFACVNASGEYSGLVKFIFNNVPGFSHAGYEKIHNLFAKWNFWILFIATLTSIPYGIFSVAAGAFNINILLFFFSTLISQAIRFLFLSILTLRLGPKVQELMKFKPKLTLKPVEIITEVCIMIAVIVVNSF